MKHALTAVLERNTTFTADFATEPYEAGWAREARWFVRTLALEGEEPQPAPDHPGLPGRPALVRRRDPRAGHDEPGLVTWRVREFGHWLRLRATLRGGDPKAKVLIYLALKS